MKVYLAGAFSRQEELQDIATELEFLGVEVTSKWLNNTPTMNKPFREAREDAFMDVRDLREADVLVRFTDKVTGATVPSRLISGARMFEFGMAWERGMPIVVVGGMQNVFDRLPNVTHVKDVEELKQWLQQA